MPAMSSSSSRRAFLQSCAALGAVGYLSTVTQAGSPSPREVNLDGIKFKAHPPRAAVEASSGHCWFADLLKFSTGEVMLNHSLNDDDNVNQHNSQAVFLSTDAGKTFAHAYDVNGFHNGCGEPRIALPDGRIVGTSTFLKPDPGGQPRRFAAHFWTYDRGGRRYQVEPWAVKVEGLPKDVEMWPAPSRTWWARINWFSDILALEKDRWLSTLSLRYVGDKLESTVAVESRDAGYTWKYLSTVAGPDDVPGATEGFDEPCLVQLADGDVMCVSRVGMGEDQKLARTYSADGGKSWSKPDRLEAYSVAPQILRLANGLLVLTTGRPGTYLWISSDPRGKTWQSFDVMAHHNATTPGEQHITHERKFSANYNNPKLQTTGYNALLEVSPNRVMLAYDRIPLGWSAIPKGEKGQIFLLDLDFNA